METLQISKTNVLKAYSSAKEEGKSLLTDLFGKEVFNQKITDRVKTFEDACKIVKPSDNIKILLDYNGIDKTMIATQALAKLTIVVKALNEGWKPDWNNTGEYKWFPIFYMNDPGFRFVGSDIWGSHSNSSGGSRMVLRSEELSNYIAKQFLNLYKDLLS